MMARVTAAMTPGTGTGARAGRRRFRCRGRGSEDGTGRIPVPRQVPSRRAGASVGSRKQASRAAGGHWSWPGSPPLVPCCLAYAARRHGRAGRYWLRTPPGSAARRRRDRPPVRDAPAQAMADQAAPGSSLGLPGEDLLRQAKPARPRACRNTGGFLPACAHARSTGRKQAGPGCRKPAQGPSPACTQRPGCHHRESSPMPPARSSAGGEQAGRLTLSRTGDQTIIVDSALPRRPSHRCRQHTGPLSLNPPVN